MNQGYSYVFEQCKIISDNTTDNYTNFREKKDKKQLNFKNYRLIWDPRLSKKL